MPGHGDLVGRDGEAALGDMEDTMRCAAVAARIVEDALRDAVRIQIGRREVVALPREAHDAGEPGAVEHERMGGKAGGAAGADVGQIRIRERVDTFVCGTIQPLQHTVAHVVVLQQRPREIEEGLGGCCFGGRFAEGNKLQVDVAHQIRFIPLRVRARVRWV